MTTEETVTLKLGIDALEAAGILSKASEHIRNLEDDNKRLREFVQDCADIEYVTMDTLRKTAREILEGKE